MMIPDGAGEGPMLQEATRELEAAIHDARVAFDCIALGDTRRAHQRVDGPGRHRGRGHRPQGRARPHGQPAALNAVAPATNVASATDGAPIR